MLGVCVEGDDNLFHRLLAPCSDARGGVRGYLHNLYIERQEHSTPQCHNGMSTGVRSSKSLFFERLAERVCVCVCVTVSLSPCVGIVEVIATDPHCTLAAYVRACWLKGCVCVCVCVCVEIIATDPWLRACVRACVLAEWVCVCVTVSLSPCVGIVEIIATDPHCILAERVCVCVCVSLSPCVGLWRL